MAVSGPLARSADDLAVALEVLAGAAGLDAQGWRLALPAPPKRALKDYKVAVMLTSPCCAQDDELTAQLQQAVDGLARAGVHVDDTARPAIDLQRAHHLFLLLLRAATGTGVSDQQFARHLESAGQRAAEDRSYRAYLDRAVTLSHRAWWQLHNEREQMRLAWADFFHEYDLFLCPAAASAAFPHDHEGERPERTIPVNGRRELTDRPALLGGHQRRGLPPGLGGAGGPHALAPPLWAADCRGLLARSHLHRICPPGGAGAGRFHTAARLRLSETVGQSDNGGLQPSRPRFQCLR